jgi:glycosyltransferase involved in cell wall biosynthesis
VATALQTRPQSQSPLEGHCRVALRVGVDATQIVFGVSGGVEVYFRTLVRALSATGNSVAPVVIAREEQAATLRRELPGVPLRILPTVRDQLTVRAKRWIVRRLVSGGATPPLPAVPFGVLEDELELDVLHSPVQMFSDENFRSPSVLNLHDLQHVHFPENFTDAELTLRHERYTSSARRADAIVASSEFTRRDILNHLDVAAEKVHTIPVACNPEVAAGLRSFSLHDARERYELPENFAFYPAATWPHKNHVRLIEALAIVRSRSLRHDLKLVCAGCRKHSGRDAIEQALDRFDVRDHVRFLDFIPTAHLGGVYRASLFCVMPSLFESSSYPVIEAQTLGVPSMCSAITSLPELMDGEAGLLFDPTSSEDIAENMLRWLNDPTDRRQRAERGRTRAIREHSLLTYASRMRDVYAGIVGRDVDV